MARAQLAQQLHETAREITHVCEQLVHDQHMQQQGWSAVVANLEDLVVAFKVIALHLLLILKTRCASHHIDLNNHQLFCDLPGPH